MIAVDGSLPMVLSVMGKGSQGCAVVEDGYPSSVVQGRVGNRDVEQKRLLVDPVVGEDGHAQLARRDAMDWEKNHKTLLLYVLLEIRCEGVKETWDTGVGSSVVHMVGNDRTAACRDCARDGFVDQWDRQRVVLCYGRFWPTPQASNSPTVPCQMKPKAHKKADPQNDD